MMSGYVTRLACVVALVLSMSPPAFAQGNPPAAEPDWVSLPRPAKPDRKNFEAMAELLLVEFKLMRQAGLKTLDDYSLRQGLMAGLEILYQARRIGANDTAARLGNELEHYVDAAYDQIRSGRLDYPTNNLSVLALAASVYRETGDTARAARYAGQMKSLFGTCLKAEEMNEQLEAVAIYYANAENYRAFFTLIDETFRSAADPCKEATFSGYISAGDHHEVVGQFARQLAMRGLVEPAKEALALLPVRGTKFDPLAFYDRYPVTAKAATYSDTRQDSIIKFIDAFEERAKAVSEIVFILAERGEPFETLAQFMAIGLGETSRDFAKSYKSIQNISESTQYVEWDTREGLDFMAAAMVRLGDVENGWQIVSTGERNYISGTASKVEERRCSDIWGFLNNIAGHGATSTYDVLAARLAADRSCSQHSAAKWSYYHGIRDDMVERAGMAIVNALAREDSAGLAPAYERYWNLSRTRGEGSADDAPVFVAKSLQSASCIRSLMRAQHSACTWDKADKADQRFFLNAPRLAWAAHYWAGSPPLVTGTMFRPFWSADVTAAPINLTAIYRWGG